MRLPAIAALCLFAGGLSAQLPPLTPQQLVSTRTLKTGEVVEMGVSLEAPYNVLIRLREGELGNTGVEYFTTKEIQGWLSGRPQGPSPVALLERRVSSGLSERSRDMTAPLGDNRTGRALFLLLEEEAGEVKYSIIVKNAPVVFSRQEVQQFLRDIKRVAQVADSIAGKKY